MHLAKGATRWVFVGRKRAYKIPSLHSWPMFLSGLLANLQEIKFSKTGWPELCPVIWHVWGGWLVVMPTAQVLTQQEWLTGSIFKQVHAIVHPEHGNYIVPVEDKPDSFGILNGRVVAIDYGN